MLVFPKLYTKRLALTQIAVEHLADLERLANNPKIAAQIVNIPHPYTSINASMRLGYVAKGFKEKTRFCFAIIRKEDHRFIGEISLHLVQPKEQIAELGYWIGEAYWNNGYISEAIAPVVDFGLNQANYQTIYATCKVSNLASQRVLEKNGFSVKSQNPQQLIFTITKQE